METFYRGRTLAKVARQLGIPAGRPQVTCITNELACRPDPGHGDVAM
jgi:hypothetical protein